MTVLQGKHTTGIRSLSLSQLLIMARKIGQHASWRKLNQVHHAGAQADPVLICKWTSCTGYTSNRHACSCSTQAPQGCRDSLPCSGGRNKTFTCYAST